MWVKILAQMSAEDARAFQRAAEATERENPTLRTPRPPILWTPRPARDEDARLVALGIAILVTRHRDEVPPEQRAFTAEDPFPVARLSELGCQFRRALAQSRAAN